MQKNAILQQAIKNISHDASFSNRWTSVTSLEKGLNCRYKFHTDISISKKTISRALGNIDPGIDVQNTRHESGIYRGLCRREQFYYFQDPSLDPPFFPPLRNNKEIWDRIRKADEKELQDYISRTERSFDRQRSTKKRKCDEIDVITKSTSISRETDLLLEKSLDDERITLLLSY